ncbi:McrC family protein [Streptomyces sp. HB132]|uniref:McrC family protein n=1 Tax=Streptomyces sp. HB132 TaxID=767388 RepID=UPI001960CE80|nr:PE-PGRS family protein [Streptomyces sp. HB132]MBM7440085.1 5-methylcytosine-specific restriction enzyme subunit McrC [Streptomyces sp. HB132]
MPDRTPVQLGEYESAPLEPDQLTPRDVDRLHALQSRGSLTLTRERAGWRLKADATVGVLVLDRVRVVITPKFAVPGEQLMSWLAYALGTPVPVTARRWDTGPDGHADLVVAALLAQCERLLREGLRRDYVRRRSVEPVLRGRLDVSAQATHRYGQLDQLHVRTFDREADIWDNRVLGSALKAALGLTANPDLARALHGVAGAFPRASDPGTALRALDRIHYTRLNARYRPAHTWARLLLRGGGVTDLLTDHGTTADGLLLAMPALWEAVVRRLGTEAVGPRGGHAVPGGSGTGITVRGDLGNVSAFRPDLLLSLSGRDTGRRGLLPVDAKYKRYDHHGVSAADVHQLLTYSSGYGPAEAPAAVIVHPRTGGHARRTLQVRGPDGLLGTIDVLGVDTRATPEQATAWIGSVLP